MRRLEISKENREKNKKFQAVIYLSKDEKSKSWAYTLKYNKKEQKRTFTAEELAKFNLTNIDEFEQFIYPLIKFNEENEVFFVDLPQ